MLALHNQRLQIRARGVDGRGISGTTRADDYNIEHNRKPCFGENWNFQCITSEISGSAALVRTTARGSRGQLFARRAVAAAIPRWNRAAVRAGDRVTQKSADAVCDFRAENVLKRAGV